MTPILYSFRRCPYAMRARLAVASAGITVELREIVLRDKAPEFLKASAKGTVPVLVADRVIAESFDIMRWALGQNDPESLLDMPSEGWDLIASADGPFKAALDRTKYAVRFQGADPEQNRAIAHSWLWTLDGRLDPWLFGARPTIADLAILPFVRQFANIDKARFDAEGWVNLSAWLDGFTASDRFAGIMTKYPRWTIGDPVTLFP